MISGASSGAKSFKTLFGIISGPIAFPTFRLDKESCTSLTLTNNSDDDDDDDDDDSYKNNEEDYDANDNHI